MELKRISIQQFPEGAYITVRFTYLGIDRALTLPVPDGWDVLTRAERVAWGKAQIAAHLASVSYQTPDDVIFPDLEAPSQAMDGYRDLPGWATWTANEASDWIAANVTDLASAKTALQAMAMAICYLRNIAIGQ